MTYQLLVWGYCLALAIIMWRASRPGRVVVVLLSMFTYGVGVDVGIQLEPPKICAIVGWLLLATGRTSRVFTVSGVFRSRFRTFALWALGVWLVGYAVVPEWFDHAAGFARSPQGKPLVQLGSAMVYLSLVYVVSDGLRNVNGARRVFSGWMYIALASACLAFLQVGAAAVGSPLFGIYRSTEQRMDFAYVTIAGRSVQRASVLAGEPKYLAMALFVSLAMCIVMRSTLLAPVARWRFLVSTISIGVAAVLTFSSGAFIVAGIYIFAGLIVRRGVTRNAAAITIVSIVGGFFVAPAVLRSVYETRISRVGDLVSNVYASDPQDARESAAAIVMIKNPHYAITGVGLGSAPFYYEQLIQQDRFRGLFVEPNSGVLWALYSFGLIGCLLLVWMFRELLRPENFKADYHPVRQLVYAVLLFFLVLHPLFWLSVVVGLAGSPVFSRVRTVSSVRARDPYPLPVGVN